MNRFEGQVALLSGASSEIGGAIAVMLAQLGFHLALTGRDASKLRGVTQSCQAYGVRTLELPADLTEIQALGSLVSRTVGELGGLDVLVHSAGVFDWASAGEADLGRWDALLDVNLRASMHLTRLSLPHMTEKGRGAVVFIASLAGRFAFGMNAAYVASKHGMVGFAGSVFEDVRDAGVKVCAICPGFVNAGASRTIDAPDGAFANLIQPQDVADAVRFVVTSSGTVCPTEILLSPQRTPFRE